MSRMRSALFTSAQSVSWTIFELMKNYTLSINQTFHFPMEKDTRALSDVNNLLLASLQKVI